MSWYDNLFALIDMRSFTSIWFWFVLAVTWSTASHFTLGVPYDLVARARRKGGQAAADAETLAHIQVRRRMAVVRSLGHWLVAFWAAVLTVLMMLGFGYGVELAQALFLLGFPLSLTGFLGLRAAAWIEAHDARGEVLWKRLARLRFWTQVIGMIAIFVTAMWGMWSVMTIRVLS